MPQIEGLQKVTRVEVIDSEGRSYQAFNVAIWADVQDDGKTFKVFVKGK